MWCGCLPSWHVWLLTSLQGSAQLAFSLLLLLLLLFLLLVLLLLPPLHAWLEVLPTVLLSCLPLRVFCSPAS
jgi:hypothetical protein